MGAVNLLARDWRVDVSTDNSTWLTMFGMADVNADISPTIQSADDYESNGWAGYEVTMYTGKLVIKVNRKADAGELTPALALCQGTVGNFGDAVRLYVRWYRKDGVTPTEAYSGRAIVKYQAQTKTGVSDVAEVTVEFTFDGQVTKIVNPYVASLAPVVASASPSGAAAGAQVRVDGQGFTGATAVKFAAVNATVFTVVSGNTIIVTVPAGTAGSAPITVTTPVGTSNALPYTRA